MRKTIKHTNEKRYKKCGGSYSRHGFLKIGFSFLVVFCLIVSTASCIVYADGYTTTTTNIEEDVFQFAIPFETFTIVTQTSSTNDTFVIDFPRTLLNGEDFGYFRGWTDYLGSQYLFEYAYNLDLSNSSVELQFPIPSFTEIHFHASDFVLDASSTMAYYPLYTEELEGCQVVYNYSYTILTFDDEDKTQILSNNVSESLTLTANDTFINLIAPSILELSEQNEYDSFVLSGYSVSVLCNDDICRFGDGFFIGSAVNSNDNSVSTWFNTYVTPSAEGGFPNFLGAIFYNVADALSVPLFGTFTLGGMLLSVFAVLCVIAFLKIYAGG